MRLAVLRVSGVGCGSCVAPSKASFLRAEGVLSVRVLGSRVEIEYDENKTSIRQVIESSGVEKYYFVEILSDGPVDRRAEWSAQKLNLRAEPGG